MFTREEEPFAPNFHHRSPVRRCRETAELIREGAGVDVAIADDSMLGAPGVFIADEIDAARNREELGNTGVVERVEREARGRAPRLRNNPGGLVDVAEGVADELLGAGTIYTTRHRGRVIDEARASVGGASRYEACFAQRIRRGESGGGAAAGVRNTASVAPRTTGCHARYPCLRHARFLVIMAPFVSRALNLRVLAR